MPGFNNPPPASEFHRHSSWGRTRGPKNILGAETIVPPTAFPTRPVMDFLTNTDGNDANDAVIEVADANKDFSFTDNVWPDGPATDPQPDRSSDKPFSASAWIHVTGDAPDHGQIVGKFNTNTAAEWIFYVRAQDDDDDDNDGSRLFFNCYNDGANFGHDVAHGLDPENSTVHKLRISTNQPLIKNDTWHHVIATYDGSATPQGLNLYIDGKRVPHDASAEGALAEEVTGVEPIPYSGMLVTNATLRIGGPGDALPADELDFERKMTDVAIYNAALNANDASQLYNGGRVLDLNTFGKSGNIVGWWRLGPGDNAGTAFDSRGNNDGTITNATIENDSSGTGPFAADGFATENQRYLHLRIVEAGNVGLPKIKVWAKSYAFGVDRWAVLGEYDGVRDSSASHTIEINGIDRVFFVWNNTGNTVTVSAACSTF